MEGVETQKMTLIIGDENTNEVMEKRNDHMSVEEEEEKEKEDEENEEEEQ